LPVGSVNELGWTSTTGPPQRIAAAYAWLFDNAA
jgi:hypothetical protein